MQLEEYVAAGGDLHRVRLLLLLLRQLARATPATTPTLITERLGLGADSLVVELASNDGYLLQYFVGRGRPGARHRAGAPTSPRSADRPRASPPLTEFFGAELAGELVAEGRPADLIVGNNVLAQVPDLNDFVGGIAAPAQARRASSRSSSRTCCG